jgi:hypothetical protein
VVIAPSREEILSTARPAGQALSSRGVIRIVGASSTGAAPVPGGRVPAVRAGGGVAVRAGARFDLGRSPGASSAVTAFQLMTHYANDYFDYEADLGQQHTRRGGRGEPRAAGPGDPARGRAGRGAVLAAVGLGPTAYLATRSGAGPWLGPTLVGDLRAGLGVQRASAAPVRLGAGRAGHAIVVTALVPFVGPAGAGAGSAGARRCCWRSRRCSRCSSRCCWRSSSPIAPATR